LVFLLTFNIEAQEEKDDHNINDKIQNKAKIKVQTSGQHHFFVSTFFYL